MRKALRTLRSRVGRVMRDVQRQVDRASDSGRVALLELIARTKRILAQKPTDKNKGGLKSEVQHLSRIRCRNARKNFVPATPT